MVIDIHNSALEVAKQPKVDPIINAAQEDPVAKVKKEIKDPQCILATAASA